MPDMTAKLMNVTAAATALGVAPTTVYRWVKEGRLPHSSLTLALYFSEADLAACAGRPVRGRPRIWPVREKREKPTQAGN